MAIHTDRSDVERPASLPPAASRPWRATGNLIQSGFGKDVPQLSTETGKMPNIPDLFSHSFFLHFPTSVSRLNDISIKGYYLLTSAGDIALRELAYSSDERADR
jgi:hypothetical protein